eukprot:TRINITY_DN46708_c0_g1_i1.p1 TRINITY_DN46708_c0_g1~~TRINITY_DN46708_c0_g1_i1.p1  ORF type:complete len:310 (+),score=68.10 TRINITY_DN46708_c0_g1_i1:52-981(+)
MSWCTIESDPVVFNEMIEKFGVKDVEVVEVPVLDVDELNRMGPIYGMIFLFKWKPVKREVAVVDADNVYFAKQVVTNACATQAIINILLNAEGVEIGKELTEFKNFTLPLDPEQRGECMGSQEVLRAVHNSFSRPQCFSFEETAASADDDAYHFTAYIPKDGLVYELDGLQPGPIIAGSSDDQSKWLYEVVPLLQSRVSEIQALDAKGNGLMFSLLAVTKDRLSMLRQQLTEAKTEAEEVMIRNQIDDVQEARKRGHEENVRRRHNYIPLVVSCLKALAQTGRLKDIADEAQKRSAEKLEAKRAAKGKK